MKEFGIEVNKLGKIQVIFIAKAKDIKNALINFVKHSDYLEEVRDSSKLVIRVFEWKGGS